MDSHRARQAKKRNSDEHPKGDGADRPEWTAPILEDVSEQVMAQPYIRFS